MTVTATSTSLYPDHIEVCCLTLSDNPIPALLSGLVFSGQPRPSGPTPLVHNATERHTCAEDSHTNRARDDGIGHNALTRLLVSISPSEGIQGAPRPTRHLIAHVTLAVPSSDPSTARLFTSADRKLKHPLPKAHRGQLPTRPLMSALTHTWAPHSYRGCSTNPKSSPLQRHLPTHPLIGGGGGLSSHNHNIEAYLTSSPAYSHNRRLDTSHTHPHARRVREPRGLLLG
jgi:hypothetical protein